MVEVHLIELDSERGPERMDGRDDTDAPRQLIALRELMGHARIETTLVYLRRKDKQRAMEQVRTLSWGGGGHFVFPPREEAARKKPPLSRGFP